MSNWPCNALILGKQPHSKLKWLRDIWNIKALPNQRGQPWKSLLQTHVFSTIRLSTCTNANPSKGTWTGWPAHKGEMTCLARAGGTGVERKRKERLWDSLHQKKPVQTWASSRPGLPVLTSNRHTHSGCYICLFEPQAPFHLYLPWGIWACPCEPTTYLPNLKLYKCQKYRTGVSTMLLF